MKSKPLVAFYKTLGHTDDLFFSTLGGPKRKVRIQLVMVHNPGHDLFSIGNFCVDTNPSKYLSRFGRILRTPHGNAGGFSREYVLRIPSVS